MDVLQFATINLGFQQYKNYLKHSENKYLREAFVKHNNGTYFINILFSNSFKISDLFSNDNTLCVKNIMY